MCMVFCVQYVYIVVSLKAKMSEIKIVSSSQLSWVLQNSYGSLVTVYIPIQLHPTVSYACVKCET